MILYPSENNNNMNTPKSYKPYQGDIPEDDQLPMLWGQYAVSWPCIPIDESPWLQIWGEKKGFYVDGQEASDMSYGTKF